MIASRNRFHGLNSLRPVYKYGQTARNQQLGLRYRLNERRRVYRCAVIVSKKVEKSAVKRNRIRRRVFETIRQLDTRIAKPYDLIVNVFNASVIDTPNKQLVKLIEDLLSKSGVIDAKSQR